MFVVNVIGFDTTQISDICHPELVEGFRSRIQVIKKLISIITLRQAQDDNSLEDDNLYYSYWVAIGTNSIL